MVDPLGREDGIPVFVSSHFPCVRKIRSGMVDRPRLCRPQLLGFVCGLHHPMWQTISVGNWYVDLDPSH